MIGNGEMELENERMLIFWPVERLLERDVAKPALPAPLSGGQRKQDRAVPDERDDDLPGHEDERELEPTPLAVEVRTSYFWVEGKGG